MYPNVPEKKKKNKRRPLSHRSGNKRCSSDLHCVILVFETLSLEILYVISQRQIHVVRENIVFVAYPFRLQLANGIYRLITKTRLYNFDPP